MIALVLLLGAHDANAACVINGARPTVPLPTMEAGQQFSFIATADCMKLRFPVPGTTFVAIPKAGTDLGTKDRTYKVVLTEREWNSLVDESDTTFTWSIIGMTSAGVTTRVTTTNELKSESVTIDLSMADAKLVGEEADDAAGDRVSAAGDVNGDGRDDLLIGAVGNDEGGSSAGAAYLVLGPVSGTFDLSRADAKLVGEAGDGAGRVASAGDVDADGHDDLLIGAPSHRPAGAAYLVLGPVSGTFDLSLADATLLGVRGIDQFAGAVVAGAGDVDNDGRDDMLVFPQVYDEGHGYLVLGPVSDTFDLSLADATLVGEEDGDLMLVGAAAGDVDADGYDDLMTGAFGNDEGGTGYAGAAYLVLGPVTGTFDLSLADAKLVGHDGEAAGATISGAGDVDSDGHDDLLVGAPWSASGGTAYLVLGPVSGTFDLSFADATLLAEGPDWAGNSVSGAGDVDGDGHDDILVGAPLNDEGAGAAYLVLGPVTGTLDLSLADAKLAGEEANDLATTGAGLAGAGDVDADGHADILIGAANNSAYVVYGVGLF